MGRCSWPIAFYFAGGRYSHFFRGGDILPTMEDASSGVGDFRAPLPPRIQGEYLPRPPLGLPDQEGALYTGMGVIALIIYTKYKRSAGILYEIVATKPKKRPSFLSANRPGYSTDGVGRILIDICRG